MVNSPTVAGKNKGKKYKIKPKFAHRKVLDNLVNKGSVSMADAIRKAGYSEAIAAVPSKITESRSWQQLMDEYLSEADLTKTHNELLRAAHLDHMTFPCGPRTKNDVEKFIAAEKEKAEKAGRAFVQEDYLTDEDIGQYLLEINCKVRRVVHAETTRHVYFWSPDNRARKDALDMAYKLQGKFAAEKHVVGVLSLKDLADAALGIQKPQALQSPDNENKTT